MYDVNSERSTAPRSFGPRKYGQMFADALACHCKLEDRPVPCRVWMYIYLERGSVGGEISVRQGDQERLNWVIEDQRPEVRVNGLGSGLFARY